MSVGNRPMDCVEIEWRKHTQTDYVIDREELCTSGNTNNRLKNDISISQTFKFW